MGLPDCYFYFASLNELMIKQMSGAQFLVGLADSWLIPVLHQVRMVKLLTQNVILRSHFCAATNDNLPYWGSAATSLQLVFVVSTKWAAFFSQCDFC